MKWTSASREEEGEGYISLIKRNLRHRKVNENYNTFSTNVIHNMPKHCTFYEKALCTQKNAMVTV